MIVGQHIQWNTICDAPNLHSILNKKLDDFIIATDPTYGTGELTYYYQVDYYNSDIIISVYQYIDGCFVRVNGCGYNNNRVQTVSIVAPTCEPQTETCCTQQSPIQCVPQQPTIPIPSATNDHTKLINKNADANFQHVTLAMISLWNSIVPSKWVISTDPNYIQPLENKGIILPTTEEAGSQYKNLVIDTATGKVSTEPIYVTLTDVIENTVTIPPIDATSEDAYIIPSGATGVWSGLTNQIAIYNGATWDFYVPQTNDVTTILTGLNAGTVKFDGINWVAQVIPTVSGWQTTGNNLTSTGIIGSISNHDVQFRSNNIPRGRLTKTGKWGFGTDNPVAGVDIYNDFALVPSDVKLISGLIGVSLHSSNHIISVDTLHELQGITGDLINGQFNIVTNKTGVDLLIINQSSSVTANRRIITGYGDIIFKKGTAISIQYDKISLRWRLIGYPISETDPIFQEWLSNNPTSGTNTGDQDLSGYLLKDTTLQTADTPEDTSLFSFWKIGVGRLKIAWSDLLNTISHNQLMGLDWLTSGHVGNANKIFGSDADGLAKEYAQESLQTQNATTNATSGTITLAKQTVTTLTTTLTNAHTLTIIPELPTVFTNRNYNEVVLTVGATAPSITWSAPSGVTFTWTAPLGNPSAGLKINTKHKLFYDWESETSCLISRREL